MKPVPDEPASAMSISFAKVSGSSPTPKHSSLFQQWLLGHSRGACRQEGPNGWDRTDPGAEVEHVFRLANSKLKPIHSKVPSSNVKEATDGIAHRNFLGKILLDPAVWQHGSSGPEILNSE